MYGGNKSIGSPIKPWPIPVKPAKSSLTWVCSPLNVNAPSIVIELPLPVPKGLLGDAPPINEQLTPCVCAPDDLMFNVDPLVLASWWCGGI